MSFSDRRPQNSVTRRHKDGAFRPQAGAPRDQAPHGHRPGRHLAASQPGQCHDPLRNGLRCKCHHPGRRLQRGKCRRPDRQRLSGLRDRCAWNQQSRTDRRQRATGEVYVVFGSQTVGNSSVTDWIGQTGNTTPPTYNYTATDRVGDLSQLGAASQMNPVTNAALGFPFQGLTFEDTGNASLGASVAGVKLGNGKSALIIGEPTAAGTSANSAGTGRAYYIVGNFAQYEGQTVNLANPSAYPGLNIVTFTNVSGGEVGTSVAGGQNILGDGNPDVILGVRSARSAPLRTPAWST